MRYSSLIVLLITFVFGSCSSQPSQTEANADTLAVVQDTIIPPQFEYVEAIDLGLSVLWADRNLGASEPADCGGYYPTSKAQDTITALLGEGWRLPTVKEMENLFHYTKYGYHGYMIDANGIRVKGKKFPSDKMGSSIFLPAAGYMEDELNMEYSTLGLYMTSTHTFNGEYSKGMWGGYWDDEEEVGYIPWHEIRRLSHLPKHRYTIRPVKNK